MTLITDKVYNNNNGGGGNISGICQIRQHSIVSHIQNGRQKGGNIEIY